MNKIYLAGSISNNLDTYKKQFSNAKSKVQKHFKGALVFNPAILPSGFEWTTYMEATNAFLKECNIIVLLPGWELSDGAKLELIEAHKLNKVVIHLRDIK